jgi:hypothetical protein
MILMYRHAASEDVVATGYGRDKVISSPTAVFLPVNVIVKSIGVIGRYVPRCVNVSLASAMVGRVNTEGA